jgi:hypothetical protein
VILILVKVGPISQRQHVPLALADMNLRGLRKIADNEWTQSYA